MYKSNNRNQPSGPHPCPGLPKARVKNKCLYKICMYVVKIFFFIQICMNQLKFFFLGSGSPLKQKSDICLQKTLIFLWSKSVVLCISNIYHMHEHKSSTDNTTNHNHQFSYFKALDIRTFLFFENHPT